MLVNEKRKETKANEQKSQTHFVPKGSKEKEKRRSTRINQKCAKRRRKKTHLKNRRKAKDHKAKESFGTIFKHGCLTKKEKIYKLRNPQAKEAV